MSKIIERIESYIRENPNCTNDHIYLAFQTCTSFDISKARNNLRHVSRKKGKRSKKRAISPTVQKMNKAIDLVHEAQEIVDNIMREIGGREHSHYIAYGKYGFNQLMGNGNPYDSGLQSIVDDIEDME